VCLIELNRVGSTVLDKSSAASQELELIRNPGYISIVSGLHKLCQPASLAVRKWRENEKMKRQWRENEELERE